MNRTLLYTALCITLLPALLGSCRSFTDPASDLYNPDNHAPLSIGTCQPGSFWPVENSALISPFDLYEKERWSGYLKSTSRQALYDELAVDWWRVDFSWKRLELEKDEWDFEAYDYLADASAEGGRKLLAVLTFDTPWLYGDENQSRNITEKELDRYLNYARTVAERYGDRLSGFEIWNEPNLNRFWKGSDEDFFNLTRETVKVLKETAPEVPVAVGALCYHPLLGGKSFLIKMIEAGALEGADVVSIHPYAISLDASARRVADVRKTLDEAGYDHRIWVTEQGFPTTGLYVTKVPQRKHYSEVIRGLTLMTAAGADVVTWYKIFDSYNPDEAGWIVPSERSFGLMSRKREYKPGARAFGLLAGELGGKRYNPNRLTVDESAPAGLEAYLYEKGKEICLVIWGGRGAFSLKGMDDVEITTFDPGTEALIPGDYVIGDYPLVITGRADGKVTVR
ncbi:MAG: cellulase family glycosylhydrolase [Spirochaetales bacterium]|nr:cellulase family glycosylhydrolase [Spirochaetales bacterium]